MMRQVRTSPAALVAGLTLLACAQTEARTVKATVGPYEVELTTTGEFGKNNYRTQIEAVRHGKILFRRATAQALAGYEMDRRDVRVEGDCLVFYYVLASDGLDDWTLFGVRICGDGPEVMESTIRHQNGDPQLLIGRIPSGWDAARTKGDLNAVFRRLFPRDAAADDGTHTPRPGSPERVAICDALRTYVARQHAMAPLKKKIVFKIDRITVNGDYAFFDGLPIYADGTSALYDTLPDMSYVFLLRKVAGRWTVLADFCGTDVPGPEWWMGVRRRLPADLPKSILPDFYRGHLQL